MQSFLSPHQMLTDLANSFALDHFIFKDWCHVKGALPMSLGSPGSTMILLIINLKSGN